MTKLFFTLSIFLVCNFSSAQNLFVNSGFETATVGLPVGTPLPMYPTLLNSWTAVNVDGEYMYDPTLANTGTGFLSVLQNPANHPKTFWLGAPWISNGYDRAMQFVSVTASTVYQLKCWIRSGNSMRYTGYGSGRLLIQVEQVSPGFIAIDSVSFYTPLSWQQTSFTFTTGATTNSITVLFSCYGTNAVDAWVDDVELKVAQPDGIQENFKEHGVSVFPNPLNDKLNIEITEVIGLSTFNLYDIANKKVSTAEFSKSTVVNTENLTKGTYFYEIRNRKGVLKTGKLIKQ